MLTDPSFLLDILVTGQDLALELLRILVPKLRGLTVQRRSTASVRTRSYLGSVDGAYLFGSPSKLCRLRSTVWMLYAAVHLSFRMSKQIRPEKSKLGW